MGRALDCALTVVLASVGGAACSSATDDGTTTGDAALATPALFYLDITGRVLRAAPDGSGVSELVSGLSGTPDGIGVDVNRGRIFWSNMGVGAADDGSIERIDLDGSNRVTVVEPGGAFTPKQIKLDTAHDKLYWSDREGMSVMRSNLDGSAIETLVAIAEGDTARLDAQNWAVGIALDLERGQIYWTQKGPDGGGVGTIKRAGLEIPAGETSATRSDVEVLFAGLPEPIDLELDLTAREIYWTDRGDNTVSRAPMDPPSGVDPAARIDREILVTGLAEAIGIALDLERGEMYFTDLGGSVRKASLDGSRVSEILSAQGALTGIAFVQVPK
jgi:hypothetical protein